MDYREWLEFECMIMDMAEKIDNAKDLQDFAEDLHSHIEIALQDHADDNGFGDEYEPSF